MKEPKFKIGDKVIIKGEVTEVLPTEGSHDVICKVKLENGGAIRKYQDDLILAHDNSQEQEKQNEEQRVKPCGYWPPNPFGILQESRFVDYVCLELDQLKELFRRKNDQYSTDDDPLANFRAGARLRANVDSWAEMYEEAKNYRRKHVVHVERHGIDGDKVDESLKDIIIYSAIMLYMYAHRQEDLKQ